MSSRSIAVRAKNLGKMYFLYNRPQERLLHTLFWRFGKSYGRAFWALKNVNFEIYRGETFGIIGKNGAGKSTLLQILAGILSPTEGTVEVAGKISALLELGSGFNMEYTGRENVLLYGSILGIPRREMLNKLEAILEFADIGDFIDQPVKLYSSGMFVRLAFATTIGVDADVILIDEALAVGDIFFRQKCYQRLNELKSQGCTIILVSHAMTEVEQFCERAMLLKEGNIEFLGSAVEAVKHYYLLDQQHSAPLFERSFPSSSQLFFQADGVAWPSDLVFMDVRDLPQATTGIGRCLRVALTDEAGNPSNLFQQGEVAHFFIEFEVNQPIGVPIGGVQLQNQRNITVHGKTTLEMENVEVPTFVPAGSVVRFHHQITLGLEMGEYTFEVGFSTISHEDFNLRTHLPHTEIYARAVRLCTLTGLGPFAVVSRRKPGVSRLSHHGIADLPSSQFISVIPKMI